MSAGSSPSFAASIATEFPAIRDFVVGNEPNLNLFWMPQFGLGGVDLAARSYELLLARTYDALKPVSDDVNVIGGALASHGQDKPGTTRPTHSPTAFIEDLGVAYRATKRARPIMDMFAIHPYLIPSKLPPSFAHPRTTTIGIADYPKLVKLLTTAFRGTAQRGETLPIVYDEFGYQSKIPRGLRSAYTDLGSKAAADAISESLQAKYYAQAFALAACQPDGRRDAHLPRRRRERRARVAVGGLLRKRQAEVEPGRRPSRRARSPGRDALHVREGEDDVQCRERDVRRAVRRRSGSPPDRLLVPDAVQLPSCVSSMRPPAMRLRTRAARQSAPRR